MKGLGILEGTVKRFPTGLLKVPHMGWNEIQWTPDVLGRFPGLPERSFVYFVHSYYPDPQDKRVVAATARYGASFAAAVATPNLLATQFHPEKSQDAGLAILEQFVRSLT